MRRGGSLLITILLLLAAFWAGIQYERNNCKIDVPQTANQVSRTVKCRDYKGVQVGGVSGQGLSRGRSPPGGHRPAAAF